MIVTSRYKVAKPGCRNDDPCQIKSLPADVVFSAVRKRAFHATIPSFDL